MKTQELIRSLCLKLGHEDAATAIVKKIVGENWLEEAEDLAGVARVTLERWEVPLKLVDEIDDYMLDTKATAISSGVSAWVNYTARPALVRMTGISGAMETLRRDAEKRNYPETWAARRLQRWWRRRKNERDQRLLQKALRSSLSAEDFKRPTERETERVRRARAEEKIRQAVRQWVERRRAAKNSQKGRGKSGSSASAAAARSTPQGKSQASPGARLSLRSEDGSERGTASNSLAAALLRMSRGEVRPCEMALAAKRVVAAMGRDEKEMMPHIHRLVTQNWLEELDDLDLVEDRHWQAWGMPEKFVMSLRDEAWQQRSYFGQGLTNLASKANEGPSICERVQELLGW